MKLVPMTDLEFARAQMGMSLAFHILFATVGIGMPVLMAMAEGMHLRGRNPVHRELARRWARGTAGPEGIRAVLEDLDTLLEFRAG
jgi:cytochrome d ubiquinol oxidase subunit I